MIEHNPLVSIVVASYNHAEYLEQRIESLLNQDYQNLEIIIIDDFSTDKSFDVLKKYENSKDMQVIYLSENMGWVKVSNLGAELAKGEFVVFANCDDFSEITQISKLAKKLESNPTAGLCFSRSNIVDESSRLVGDDFEMRGRKFKGLCMHDALIESSAMIELLFHSIVIPNLSAAMFRKSSFDEVGKFSEEVKVAADWELYFRMAQEFDVFYVKEALNNFRSHQTSIRSTTKIRDMQKDIAELIISKMSALIKSRSMKFRVRFRLAYLIVLVVDNLRIVKLGNLLYLIKFITKQDKGFIVIFPIALCARILRLPIGAAIKIGRILKNRSQPHAHASN